MIAQNQRKKFPLGDIYITGREWFELYEGGFFERYFPVRNELISVLAKSGPFKSRSEIRSSAWALLEMNGGLSTGGIVTNETFLFSASAILAYDCLKSARAS